MRTVSRTLVAISILTVGLAQSAGAQQKPNFSGRWVITSPADSAGQEQLITQDAKTLTVEHPSESGGHKMSYQLDGVERRMAIPGKAAADITMLAKASWDGNTIVVFTDISYPNGMKTQSKDVWSIDAQGRLVIDTTERGPTGPAPAVKMIHVKKK
jgi:hypothetical protein